MKILFFTFINTFFVFVALGQNNDSMVDGFFEFYTEDRIKAVDYIFSTNPLIFREKQESIETLKTQLLQVTDLLGSYYGYEKLTEKQLGKSYKVVTTMVKYERQPLRFLFIMYKPNDKWQIQNFQFDDAIDEDLEKASRLYWLLDN